MRRRRSKRVSNFCIVGATLLVLIILVIEEYYVSRLINVYNNYYRTTIYANVVVQRANDDTKSLLDIAVITVVFDLKNTDEYVLAQQTLECYARYHRYQWLMINMAENATLRMLCPQRDFMFARHCVLAQLMEELEAEWILFVDADIGVINPNHLIEQWIDSDVNIIFYNRIFNHEVMAGSYLARNSDYTRKFLRTWAAYENKLPKSMHGSDNGALHNVILETILPNEVEQRHMCEKLWNKSRDYLDLSVYEVCVRNLIGDAPKWPGKIKILPKASAWARDTWLTNSMWSKNDFMMHGWQKRKIDGRRIDGVLFAAWPSPFVSHQLDMSLCNGDRNVGLNWQYKDTFIRSELEIEQTISRTIRIVHKDYQSISKQLQMNI